MKEEHSKTKESIDKVLQETRIVLPGVNVLLGFQFVTFFNPTFQGLSKNLQYALLLTLILTVTSAILLVAPVAFQQIGEEGRLTKKFLHFTQRMLKSAMTFLLLALVGDVFIATRLIELSIAASIALALFVFLLGAVLWYGFAYSRRNARKRKESSS